MAKSKLPPHAPLSSKRPTYPPTSLPPGNAYRKSSGMDVTVKRGALQNPVKIDKELKNTRWMVQFPGVISVEAGKKTETFDGRLGKLGGLDTAEPWLLLTSPTSETSLKFTGRKYWSSSQYVPVITSKKAVKIDDVFTGIVVFDKVEVTNGKVKEEGGEKKLSYKRSGGSELADPFKVEMVKKEKKAKGEFTGDDDESEGDWDSDDDEDSEGWKGGDGDIKSPKRQSGRKRTNISYSLVDDDDDDDVMDVEDVKLDLGDQEKEEEKKKKTEGKTSSTSIKDFFGKKKVKEEEDDTKKRSADTPRSSRKKLKKKIVESSSESEFEGDDDDSDF